MMQEKREQNFNLHVSGANATKGSNSSGNSSSSGRLNVVSNGGGAGISKFSLKSSDLISPASPALQDGGIPKATKLSASKSSGEATAPLPRRKQWKAPDHSILSLAGAKPQHIPLKLQQQQSQEVPPKPAASASANHKKVSDANDSDMVVDDIIDDDYDDDDFERYDGSLSISNKGGGGLLAGHRATRASKEGEETNNRYDLNSLLPGSSGVFLPKKKVNTDHLTPLRRPSSARLRAVRADMIVQSVDFGALSRDADPGSAKHWRSAKVAASGIGGNNSNRNPPAEALMPLPEASVTGSLLGQIKNLTPDQQKKLLRELQGISVPGEERQGDEELVKEEEAKTTLSDDDAGVRRAVSVSTPASETKPLPVPAMKQDATPQRISHVKRQQLPRTFEHGFGNEPSSTDSTPSKFQLEQNDMLEQSFESLSRFNALGRSRISMAAASGAPAACSSPAAAVGMVQFVDAREAQERQQVPSPNQEDRMHQTKGIMEQIAEAEKSLMDANKFSSSDEDEEDDDDCHEEVAAFDNSSPAKALGQSLKSNLFGEGDDETDREAARELGEKRADTIITGDSTTHVPADPVMMMLRAPLDASISLTNDSTLPSTVKLNDSAKIPTLPSGRFLSFEILSTWGDPYYVGFAGIEIFDHEGKLIRLSDAEQQVSAEPPDVNCLEGSDGGDPRTTDKLFDGTCHTCDDLHAWLTPWGLRDVVKLVVDLSKVEILSMVRVWNYNKSRQHSYRGARLVRISLDGDMIFEGEIRKACGSLSGPDECSDAVLFTTDDEVVRVIEERDEMLYPEFRSSGMYDVSATLVQRIKKNMECDRPRTAGSSGGDGKGRDFGRQRPVTRARRRETGGSAVVDKNSDAAEDDHNKEEVEDDIENMLKEADIRSVERTDSGDFNLENLIADVEEGAINFDDSGKQQQKAEKEVSASNIKAIIAPQETFACEGVMIKIHSTYEAQIDNTRMSLDCSRGGSDASAYSRYVGLGSIRLIRWNGSEFLTQSLEDGMVDAAPKDLYSMGYEGDRRRLSNLYRDSSGKVSIKDEDMWLVPDSITGGVKGADGSVTVRINFGRVVEDLWGFEVWNYNKVGGVHGDGGKFCKDVADEDSLRGAKVVSVWLKNYKGIGQYCAGAYSLRKGPCCDAFDYKQTLQFGKPHAIEAEDFLARDVKGGIDKLKKNGFKPCPTLRQDYETPFLPCGMMVKMVIHGGWGDQYYVGLDAFEMYDALGAKVKIGGVGAAPKGLCSIGMKDDGRTVEGLGHGTNSWLAPLAKSMDGSGHVAPAHEEENVLYFTLDEPTHIGAVRIKNYCRTVNRGVRDFSLWVDGMIVYRGYMERADNGGDGHIVLFCGEERLLQRLGLDHNGVALGGGDEKGGSAAGGKLAYCGTQIMDVVCVDEGVVRVKSRHSEGVFADPCAEGVVPDLSKRPATSSICRT